MIELLKEAYELIKDQCFIDFHVESLRTLSLRIELYLAFLKISSNLELITINKADFIF